MDPLYAYLDRLHEIRASKHGTPELSYRAALETLLNAAGDDLDPAAGTGSYLDAPYPSVPTHAVMRRDRERCKLVSEAVS